MVYRAYRYPYSYVPQIEPPQEVPVQQLDCRMFRVPGAAEGMLRNEVSVAGTWGYEEFMDACVTEDSVNPTEDVGLVDEEESTAAF